jgi:hypothetical protein
MAKAGFSLTTVASSFSAHNAETGDKADDTANANENSQTGA